MTGALTFLCDSKSITREQTYRGRLLLAKRLCTVILHCRTPFPVSTNRVCKQTNHANVKRARTFVSHIGGTLRAKSGKKHLVLVLGN